MHVMHYNFGVVRGAFSAFWCDQLVIAAYNRINESLNEKWWLQMSKRKTQHNALDWDVERDPESAHGKW